MGNAADNLQVFYSDLESSVSQGGCFRRGFSDSRKLHDLLGLVTSEQK